MKYIEEAFEKNWIAPLGFNCDSFEKEINEYVNDTGAERKYHSLCLTSGTSSLHLAVKLAGIKRGDKVLCSDMTFAATVNPIVYEGGVPVFVDSERESWNIDPKALEKAFEKHPDAKAVMIVCLYGTPAKMDEIIEVCRRHNAVLIEDAAEALSSEYKGQKCGTFGDYSVFSFNGNKIITTSGGGMLLCTKEEDRKRALFLATQAREDFPWYQHEEIGYNYRMSNVVAGIGRGQLKFLSEHKSRKAMIYEKYKEAFKDIPVTMNPYLPESSPNFWLSCFTVNEGCSVDPLKIMEKLEEHNVESRPIWKPMHMQPVFKACDFVYIEEKPVDENIFARGLCLPSDIKMTADEQQHIIDIIKSCF